MDSQIGLLKKNLIIGVIILLILATVAPSISGYDKKPNIQSVSKALYISPINDDYINSYWKFDECSGNTVGDSSGHSYDGTVYGAGWTDEGFSGCALVFDGVDDYVNFSNHAAEILINNTDDIILSFYFKSTGEGIIFSGTASWGFNPEFKIELVSNGSLLFYTVMSFQGTVLYSDGAYNDGEWHFVEYYFNGISTSPTATLYVDNVLDNSVTHFLHDFENIDFTKAKMGVHVHTATDYFEGIIDEFKIIKYEKGNEQEPPTISGPAYGPPGEDLEYKFVTDDPEGDEVWILIDWGDGTEEDWRGPYASGEEVTIAHQWDEEGTYEIKAKSKDIWDDSSWSDIFEVIIGYQAFPKICCDPVGLNFGNVSAGSTVTGQIYVLNCGDPGSFLKWYIDTTTLPTWGTWTFTPESGEGVAEGDSVTVDVTCVVTDTTGTYSGEITVYNTDNPSDKCVVDTSIIVPRTKTAYNSLFQWFLESFQLIEMLFKLINL